MEAAYLETLKTYLAATTESGGSTNANVKAPDDLHARIDATNAKLDKTIEVINGNFRKLTEKIKALQTLVDSLQKTIADDKAAKDKERADRMAEDLANKLSMA